MKRVFACVALGLILLLPVTGCVDPRRFPSPQGQRVGDDPVVGIDAGGSMAWVISTQSGVVLVDAGWDPEALSLKEEIGDRQVHAILLTHGHFDHTGALRVFPHAQVIVGPGESPLVRGEEAEQGWMANFASLMAPDGFTPDRLTEFVDGEVLDVDGAAIRALHVPGHTVGSAMYIYGDVLFTGDTVVGRGDEVNEIPRGTYTDYDRVRNSVRKVMGFPFERIADGHVGIHENARVQVQAFVDVE